MAIISVGYQATLTFPAPKPKSLTLLLAPSGAITRNWASWTPNSGPGRCAYAGAAASNHPRPQTTPPCKALLITFAPCSRPFGEGARNLRRDRVQDSPESATRTGHGWDRGRHYRPTPSRLHPAPALVSHTSGSRP